VLNRQYVQEDASNGAYEALNDVSAVAVYVWMPVPATMLMVLLQGAACLAVLVHEDVEEEQSWRTYLEHAAQVMTLSLRSQYS
jgi:hypothetical protein